MHSLPITQEACLSIHLGQSLLEGKDPGCLVPALQTSTGIASLHPKAAVRKEEGEVQWVDSSSSRPNLVYFQHLSYYDNIGLSFFPLMHPRPHISSHP